MTKLTDATQVLVDLGDLMITQTFGAFVTDNDFDAEEAAAIRSALDAGEVYTGGGGAAGEWNVQMAATALGDEFAAILETWATEEEWQTMLDVNARDNADSPICASHDFCDANMAMDEAFTKVLKRQPNFHEDDGMTETPDVDLWNAAWAYAKAQHLTRPVAQ